MEEKYSLDNIALVGDWSISTSAISLCMPKLLQTLLSNKNKVLEKFSFSGTLLNSFEEFYSLLIENGARLLVNTGDAHFTYVWEDESFIEIYFNKKTETNKNISISVFSVNPKTTLFLKELDEKFISKVKSNLIFTIVKSGNELTLKNMGDGSSELFKENYNSEVIEGMEYVISSFKKKVPIGRIAILNGSPGTGKTFLIRNMLSKLDCVFIIVPSSLIDHLDKPEFLPLLLKVKDDHHKPIIMVIEDGDTCLVPRKNDNISVISSLLNLSDGILGSIVDIRMIISTNAHIKDMDEAILRPGRLCRQIHVDPLEYNQANKVYQRLTQDGKISLPFQKYYTLAEVYDVFNSKDISPMITQTKQVKTIGFVFSQPEDQDRILNKNLNEIK